ncbi:unnamed protein product, partial [Phaeothamnion confervicola]
HHRRRRFLGRGILARAQCLNGWVSWGGGRRAAARGVLDCVICYFYDVGCRAGRSEIGISPLGIRRRAAADAPIPSWLVHCFGIPFGILSCSLSVSILFLGYAQLLFAQHAADLSLSILFPPSLLSFMCRVLT